MHTEFVRERALPGQLILGADSHSCSAGAVSVSNHETFYYCSGSLQTVAAASPTKVIFTGACTVSK